MKSFSYLFKFYYNFVGKRIFLLLLLTIVVAFTDGIGLAMIIPLLSSVEKNDSDDSNILIKMFEYFNIDNSLHTVLLIMFLIFFLKAILKFGQGVFQAFLYKNLFYKIKNILFNKIFSVRYEYFLNKNSGYYIELMNMHSQQTLTSFKTFVAYLCAIIMALTYIIFSSFISFQTSMIALLIGCLSLAFFILINRYVRKVSLRNANETTILSQITIQSLNAIKYLISSGSKEKLSNMYNSTLRTIQNLIYKSQSALAFTASLKELISINLVILVIVIEVVYFEKSITSIIVVLLLYYRGLTNLIRTQRLWVTIMETIGFIKSVDNELKALNKNISNNGIKKYEDLISNKHFIEISNLEFRFEKSKNYLFKNFNLIINKNEITAFVGPSGSGKTTIIDLITGILESNKNSIKINGVCLSEIDKRSWRKKIGFVSQDIKVFDDTVKNNITLWNEKYTDDEIYQVAKDANALEFILKLENGFETRIGENGAMISGGQKQRLFLARELLKKPDLLILDEATSALDTKSENYIQQRIEKLKNKMSIIIIAHRVSTLKNSDIIFYIDDGKLLESGSYIELKNKENGHFNKLLK